MTIYKTNQVADYIIFKFREDNLTNLKLQKLLYYIQAWSLAIRGTRFIDCEFEAWIHGPVCRELYDRFKGLYTFVSLETEDYESVVSAIQEEDREFIDFILDNYGGFSGSELENMSHQELPWQDARKGCRQYEFSNNVISEKIMEEYYGEKWKRIQEANTNRQEA
jgi:uncharacterized phage-associated protein